MSSRLFGGRRVGREEVPELVKAFLSDLGLTMIPHHIVGSWVRGLPECEEIDLVLILNESQRVEVNMAIKKAFGRMKAKDEPKMHGIYDGVLLELHVVGLENLGAMMIHAAGSWQFNKLMRARALAKGWILNKDGLFDSHSGEPVIQASDEALIFAVLEMPYIEWENRSQGCEFELKSLLPPYQLCKYRLVETGWEVVE